MATQGTTMRRNSGAWNRYKEREEADRQLLIRQQIQLRMEAAEKAAYDRIDLHRSSEYSLTDAITLDVRTDVQLDQTQVRDMLVERGSIQRMDDVVEVFRKIRHSKSHTAIPYRLFEANTLHFVSSIPQLRDKIAAYEFLGVFPSHRLPAHEPQWFESVHRKVSGRIWIFPTELLVVASDKPSAQLVVRSLAHRQD